MKRTGVEVRSTRSSEKGATMSKTRTPHDGSYRRLFSHTRMVEDLIRRYVDPPWVDRLDFSTLEIVPAHFVSEELEQRESDVVWRLRYRPSGWRSVSCHRKESRLANHSAVTAIRPSGSIRSSWKSAPDRFPQFHRHRRPSTRIVRFALTALRHRGCTRYATRVRRRTARCTIQPYVLPFL